MLNRDVVKEFLDEDLKIQISRYHLVFQKGIVKHLFICEDDYYEWLG